jgi:transposase
MGKLILLHNSDLSWDEALSYTKSRDVVEKMFRVVKNDLSGLPLRVHKEETLRGYLFVIFLSLVLYFELQNRMNASELQKKYSVETLLMELGKLRMVKLLNGNEMLTEVTKKQREIIKKMKLNNLMPKK